MKYVYFAGVKKYFYFIHLERTEAHWLPRETKSFVPYGIIDIKKGAEYAYDRFLLHSQARQDVIALWSPRNDYQWMSLQRTNMIVVK